MSGSLRIAGKKPVTVVQNQGLYACINTIRAVGLDASLLIVFLVGQFGREFANFGQDPSLAERVSAAQASASWKDFGSSGISAGQSFS